jgi:hypothetical protein
MQADGYSLDAGKHEANNLPDILKRWQLREGEGKRARTEQSFLVPKAESAGFLSVVAPMDAKAGSLWPVSGWKPLHQPADLLRRDDHRRRKSVSHGGARRSEMGPAPGDPPGLGRWMPSGHAIQFHLREVQRYVQCHVDVVGEKI